MSESESESDAGIDDEQLPEDLQPGEDNPLAEPLDEDVDPEELDVLEGKRASEDPDAPDDPDDPDDSGDSGDSGDSDSDSQDRESGASEGED